MKINEKSVTLSSEEVEELIDNMSYNDKKITEKDRWSTYYEGVAEIEGKHYMLTWCEGSTEIQDTEIEGGEFDEVIQKEVLIKMWVNINQGG
jgi:hypothetical protein